MLHSFWQSDIVRLNCCRLLFKCSFIGTETDEKWKCGCLCLSVSPVTNGLSVFEPFVHEVSPVTLSRTKYGMYKKRKQGGTGKYPVQEGKRLYSSIKLNFGTRFCFVPCFLLVGELLAWPLSPLLWGQNKHWNGQKSGFPLSRVLSERQ